MGIVFYELIAGLAVGLLAGFAGAWVMRRAALPSSGLYPLAVMSLCFLAYGSAAFVHASGFAAVYVAALGMYRWRGERGKSARRTPGLPW